MDMIQRRKSKVVSIGQKHIGGDNPILVQSMWDDVLPSVKNIDAIMQRLEHLASIGCDIIRFSYPSVDDHEIFSLICRQSPIPVIADIHFDYKLALDALACGAQKIRINPGNIGSRKKVEEIVDCAKDHGAAIRIGLNAGSFKAEKEQRVIAMVDTALEYISWFEGRDFTDSVISLKSSDEEETHRANVLLASKTDYPIHLGVTEAGGIISSVTRSTWALGRLLAAGIGDTLRISITDTLESEILAGHELLRTLNLASPGVRIVSCPRCGRYSFDTQQFLKKIEPKLSALRKPLTVAIMGCQVNGPGEASYADVAISGIGNAIFLYKKGELWKEVTVQEAEDALMSLLEEIN